MQDLASQLEGQRTASERAAADAALQSHRLEESLTQKEEQLLACQAALRELDPSHGHPLRGVSVHHVCGGLLDAVREAQLSPRAPLRDLEGPLLSRRGEAVPCPRDGLPGATYVDCLRGVDEAGASVHLLSCSDTLAVQDLASALQDHCRRSGADPRRTYLWRASFCRLRRRPSGDQGVSAPGPLRGTFQVEHSEQARQVGSVLAVVERWDCPEYLLRLWAASALFGAPMPGLGLCELEVALHPRDRQQVREALLGSGAALGGAWRALQQRCAEAVQQLVAEDPYGQVHRPSAGATATGAADKVAQRMREWLSKLLEGHVRELLISGELSGEPGALVCDNVGWMLRESELHEVAGRLFQDGLQMSMEAARDRGGRGSSHARGTDRNHAPRADVATRLDLYEAMTTLEVYDQVSWIFEHVEEHETPSVATLLTTMGVLKSNVGDYAGALEALWHARRIRVSTGTFEGPAGAVVMQNIGYAHDAAGDLPRALEAYQEAASLRHAAGATRSPNGVRLQEATRWRWCAPVPPAPRARAAPRPSGEEMRVSVASVR
ncbi:unnamed protein product [Prorocentrum cordatum]|uniref:Kinesin light chain n=1 Tax=Prorocentrum cordatum TaxID=2364126 RepID=A0ABN9SSK1_9DINO|nr:unnamed protein product [Polarella glacialis]